MQRHERRGGDKVMVLLDVLGAVDGEEESES